MEENSSSPALARDQIALVGFSPKLGGRISASLQEGHRLQARCYKSVDEATTDYAQLALICLFDGLGTESDLMRLRGPTVVVGNEDPRTRSPEVIQLGAIAYYCASELRAPDLARMLAAYQASFTADRGDSARRKLYDAHGPTLGLVEWSQDLIIARWSREAELLLGFPRAQVEGKALADWLMPAEDLDRFIAGARGLAEGLLGNFKINCLAKRADGSVLPTNWRVTPLGNEARTYVAIFEPAQPLDIIAQGRDFRVAPPANRSREMDTSAITADQETLAHQAAFLANAVEHLAIGVFFKEARDGMTITVWNAEMERLFQIPKNEIIGKRVDEVFDDPVLYSTLCDVKAQRSRSRAIMPRNRRSETPSASFIADITKTPILDEAGRVTALIGIVHDVTDRIRSENRLVAAFNELEASKEKLELSNLEIRRGIEKAKKLAVAAQASNKAKTFFMSNISHELRTPLTSIISLSHALLEQTFGKLNPRQHEFLSIISESAQHLQGLITDILDLSKIELGKLSLKIAEASISDLANATIRMVAQMAQNKRIECKLSVSTESDSLDVDGKRLRQILLNLISNAIKFTKVESTITLEIFDRPELDAVVFQVRDNGIGINKSDVEKIFLPFTQLDDSLSKQYEGTGLGLAIVAKLVELHGGSLSVTSERNAGATFSFVLPRNQPDLESQPELPSLSDIAQQEPSRSLALVVDENERAAWQLREAALAAGIDRVVIALPNEIAAYFDQLQPSLLLVDLSTAAAHGSDWMRRAKSHPRWSHTRWIGVTSLDIPNSASLAHKFEVEPLFPKPIAPAALRQALDAQANA